MHRLDVDLLSYQSSSSLFTGCHAYPTRLRSLRNLNVILRQLTQRDYTAQLFGLARAHRKCQRQLSATAADLSGTFADHHFTQPLFADFQRVLYMLSFSTPYAHITEISRLLTQPYVKSHTRLSDPAPGRACGSHLRQHLPHRRQIIRDINGHDHTCYAGAYLSNGLHEGAVTSAMAVAKKVKESR